MELRKLTDIEIGTVATIDSFTDEETSIKVSGYKLSLRKKEAATILVR